MLAPALNAIVLAQQQTDEGGNVAIVIGSIVVLAAVVACIFGLVNRR